jgi:hypothetical protein
MSSLAQLGPELEQFLQVASGQKMPFCFEFLMPVTKHYKEWRAKILHVYFYPQGL